MTTYTLQPVGHVESPLRDLASAPRQADEGAPPAWVVVNAPLKDAMATLAPGDEIIVVTWLDRARRDVLQVHPRGDTSRPREGVFSTRSPHRPNPIGLHRATITRIDGSRIEVRELEAIDGTPVLDIKPLLSEDTALR